MKLFMVLQRNRYICLGGQTFLWCSIYYTFPIYSKNIYVIFLYLLNSVSYSIDSVFHEDILKIYL